MTTPQFTPGDGYKLRCGVPAVVSQIVGGLIFGAYHSNSGAWHSIVWTEDGSGGVSGDFDLMPKAPEPRPGLVIARENWPAWLPWAVLIGEGQAVFCMREPKQGPIDWLLGGCYAVAIPAHLVENPHNLAPEDSLTARPAEWSEQ